MKASDKSISRRIVRNMDRAVDSIVLILLVLLLLFGIYSLVDSKLVYMSADAANYEVYRPTEDDSPSFKELQRKNPECFGWLYVINTPIDYPVCQAKDNEKYVNTNAFGEYSMVGNLFLDYRNDIHCSDYTNIIYGHHMERDKMFGSLDDFKDPTFFEEHPYANFYFDGKKHGVKLFAFLLADAYDTNIYRIVHGDAEAADKEAYMDYIESNALRFRQMDFSSSDSLLVLSTCTEDLTNGRFVLVGKLVDKPFKEPDRTMREFGLGLGNRTGFWALLPLWKWMILFAILLLLLLFIIIWFIEQRRLPKEQRTTLRQEFRNIFYSFRSFIQRK